MRAPLFAAVIAVAAAAQAAARTVTVHVSASTCSAATLRAVSAGGTTFERRWSGDDVAFELGDGAWKITASAPDCWAAPADASNAVVAIRLWPAATVRFRAAEPGDVELRVASSDGRLPPATVDCAREGPARTCRVPATTVDLRLGADGFVPTYVWGKEIAPRSRLDLGEIRLTRGASVSGRVTLPLKEPKLEGVTVQLALATTTTSGDDYARRALLTQTVKTNRRGFFQFAGVSEGNYTLVARADGWSPASENDVRVTTGAEVALPKPMALTPLAAFQVVVDPPTDSGGKPWHIELFRTWPKSDPPLIVKGVTSPAGEWSGTKLEGGTYDVSVNDAAGSVFHRQFATVTDDAPPLHVSIDAFRVRGRVTFRGEPLQSTVTLTQPFNATAMIRARTDKEGKFEAVLPEEAQWRVQIVAGGKTIYLRPLDIRRRSDGAPVELDLMLPTGRIRGKTVDEKGDAIPAAVEIMRDGHEPVFQWTADGNFDVIGIEPADVKLRAVNEALDRDGGTIPVHVTEADADPLTVVVPKRKKLKTWLATPDGQPVAGALVRYGVANWVQETISGPGGEITLPLSVNQPTVWLAILPPGLPRKVLSLDVSGEPREIVIAPIAARLLVRRTPRLYAIEHDGTIVSGGMLVEPFGATGRPPRESTPDGLALDLEPGTYSVCDSFAREHCKTLLLQAGTTTPFDFSEVFK